MATKICSVSHLGGIDASYKMPAQHDPSKATLLLVNSMTTSCELYGAQFGDPELASNVNLLSIEPLGHGQTRAKCENWTYWDSAYMNLQVLDALGIKGKVFALGTSQGGWIVARMALLAPERIAGLIPLGTSMDSESERTRSLGCWDAPNLLLPTIQAWSTQESTPEFEPSKEYCDLAVDTGLGENCLQELRTFWTKTIKKNYAGDEGRKRIRMCAINLRERDTLHSRLFDIRCPVMWMHGTDDVVYSLKNAEEEIKMFTNSPHAELIPVQDGKHFLSASHPKEVNAALVGFIRKHHS